MSYRIARVIAFCCRLHASGDAVHEDEPKLVEERQAHPQPEDHSGPPQEESQSRIAQTRRRRRRQSIAGDHAADEPQITGPAAAAEPAQHLERADGLALVAQTPDSRPRGPVRGDRAQPAERPQTQFARRHPDTGAGAKELNATGLSALLHRHGSPLPLPLPPPPKETRIIVYIILSSIACS